MITVYLLSFSGHYIEEWCLKSVSFGCSPKSGRATADDHLRECENGLSEYGLTLADVVAGTTDTEPTMTAFMKSEEVTVLCIENGFSNMTVFWKV